MGKLIDSIKKEKKERAAQEKKQKETSLTPQLPSYSDVVSKNNDKYGFSAARTEKTFDTQPTEKLGLIDQIKRDKTSANAGSIIDRLNTWYKNSNNFMSNYQTRFSGLKGTYEDAYDSGISDWLSTVTEQKSRFDAEAESILSYLSANRDLFDEEWLNTTVTNLDYTRKQQDDILKHTEEINKHWSQWESEDAYKRYQKISSIADMTSEQIKQYLNGTDPVAYVDDNGQDVTWETLYNSKYYKEFMDAEDFAENSQYKSTYRGGEKFHALSGTYTDSGFDDIMYDYINRNETAKQRQMLTDLAYNASFLGLDNSERGEMTDDEIAIFNYLYATRGSDEAYAYIDYLTTDLNARQRETEEAYWKQFAKESPVGSSVFSVVTSPLKGLSYVGQIADFAQDGVIDQNEGYNKFSYTNSAIRNEVSNTVEQKWGSVGSFTYQVGMSMADFLFTTAITGGNEALSLAIMGTSAAADTVVSAMDRGLESWQAFTLGTAAGAIEALTEKIGMDALFDAAKLGKGALGYVLSNTFAEGAEEGLSNILNLVADVLIAGDKSEWQKALNEGKTLKQVIVDHLMALGLDVLGGAISGGLMGGGGVAVNAIGNTIQGKEYKKTYGSDIGGTLASEAVAISPDNKFAQRMQTKAESGKELSGRQVGKLVQQNESTMRENDVQTIKTGAANRLAELGESGNVDLIATALAKQIAGEDLTSSERAALKKSAYGSVVAEEMKRENIENGYSGTEWAQKLGTDRINADVYNKMISELDQADNTQQVTGKLPASKTDIATDNDHIPDATKKVEAAQIAEPTVASEAAAREVEAESATNETPEVNEAPEGKVEASKADNGVTLEAASKAYGAQAGAMIHTYAEGQDVAQYDAAYRAAYDMGKSGVGLSYAMQSEATAYLTEKQRELAHAAGVDASAAAAKDLDAKNKAAANGKTGRRKGTVKGEGVTISDLKASLNDTQGRAYKILSTVAEVTGIDIVLYKSEANADGMFEGAQGRFKWSEDTIYIDINAGLANIKGVNDLAKYTMVRTFSHEFSHFLEKWNPIWYNELRKVVFDTITAQGENVDSLIAIKMEQTGLDYDQASREVVAEALTDILPDATFVETLATKHRNVFEQLLAKLKEFLADLKAYFSSIGPNSAREANALKEQIGDTVKYFENVVALFDRVAVEAVENYQMTVAIEEKVETKSDFAKSFENATQAERDEVVEAINANNKLTRMAPTEIRGEKPASAVEETDTEVDAPVETEADTRSIEEREKEYKKKYSSWLKNAIRQYALHYGGETFLSNGAFGLRASEEMVSFARSEFVGQIYETDAPVPAKNALDNADALLTEAPLEGTTLDNKSVYIFNIDGKQMVYDKKLLAKLDGNLLYMGSYMKTAKIIKAVDTEGRVVGFLLPMKMSYEVTDTKPSKLKSFSNKFLSQISNQEVKANGEEAGTVLPHRSDGQGDSRLLAESQTEDVPGDGAERNAVDDSRERGDEAGRSDMRPDAEGSRGRSGEGDRESGDLRRDDGLTPEAEKLHEEVAEQIEQKSTEQPRGRNFVIGDSLDLPSGEKARYKANIEAIRLVKQLEAEGRYATEAEQIVLSKYVGWGGLANAFDQRKSEWAKEYTELKELLTKEEYELARGSTLNAHYTDISVIKAMYDGLAGLGFNGGRLLEPSSGVGNFVGAMPTEMSAKVKSFTMVELDGITGLIAKYLYPNADVRIQGFEKAIIPDNYMDVAISNVPFGNYPITDKAYPKKVTSAIHNYFFAKSLDKVRPGGIVMFITSSYTMNSKDSTVRRYIMQKADLLGAIRLPDSAFKGNAGTEVVTDIIVLKKRAANTEYAGEDFLEAPYKNISGYNGAYINSYFDAHPEMVLGTATMDGGMYRSNTLTYKALEGKGSLGDQIREAFKSIKGKMDYTAAPSREKTNFAVERAGKKTKENGLVVKEGKVYQNKGGELVEVQTAKGAAERISGMLEIRDAARELMTYQQQGLNEGEIKKARTKLNRAYDEFVKKYGYINSQANKTAIKDDPDKFSIFALENYDSEKKTATKADIFSKNTIAPNRTVTSAKDVSEGLIVSINQTGGVDAALIARLTGKTEADVTRELIDSRKAFKTRSGGLEAAETYLSGNVRAKLRDAEALSMLDADYKNNVEALKSVMPEDVGYQDIFVNPGTPWIPNSVYSDFAAYMLGGRNTEWRQDVDITRNPETGNFTVELKNRYLKTNAANTQKWGTARRSFLELFDAMLNSKSVVIKDKLEDGSSVINRDATAAANEKIENIQKEFTDWLWSDESRRGELATLYNEIFNSIVTPKYNGDNLTVNGANAMKPLRPHQRNAVQRVISSGGNTLLAHKVGAGKTYEMAAAAMKLKELGLVKKPMFAVPKSLVAQWGNEFKDFFPTAKLLVAEASDFTAANRKVFMNRIANGEYDAVIVSYEQFEKLPMSDDFTRNLYQEQIDSVVAAIEEAKAEKGAKSLSIKDLEKKRKSLQAKIDKLTDKAKDEDNIDFEQLGVDSLFVDEAHNFKNLFYTTSMTNVSGLGNKDGSKRAFDLYTKVRWLQQLNGGRGIVFATATPVMNSMSEMYIMQKYLQPDLINQLGLSTFDAWAKQFGEVVNGVEIKPSGQGYRVKQSFSRFKNMNELQLLFRNFADVLTDIPGLKIPKMKGGRVNVVVCEPGQFQQEYMEELAERAENVKNVDPSVDNMLKITSDGRKISYTQRMIDPSLPYEEGCKIYRCADNVVKAYNESRENKGTQLIFCDMATPKGKSNTNENATEDIETDNESAQLYDDIKARLIKNGIPAKEIAFIHEADTDAKKKKLFADVNDGKVRVLIGSTGKMGVGMNAQKRVVAIHHLDAPWRPGDVEQRNGRAFRQGNINDEVECFTYVTEGSFDARLWDILERKQNFINQIMNGESVGREAEDTGEVTLSAAEVKALASGSPLILEQVQLDTDIKKLESLYRAHLSAIRSAKARLLQDEGTVATLEKYIEAGKADLSARVDTYSEGKFSINVGKTTFTDKKDAGAALMAAAIANAATEGYTTIGSFAGFDIRVIKTSEGIKGLLSGKQGYSFNTYPERPTYMITHLSGVAESIDEKVKLWQHNLEEVRNDIAEQEKLIAEPFGKQAELDAKRARYTEVMDILNPKEEQSLDSVAEDTVQEQSRAYLGDRDSDGNTLTQSQTEYFKDSKARDESGNLLVLYHGTANAGFTVFDPSRGKFGGSWFTTSRKDADSYGGNYSHKLFDPSETDDIRTSAGGNYTLGSWMRFDTEADRAEFLRKYPNAENIKTDAEYDALLREAEKNRDWDEYDRIEEEQAENRKELKKLERAYGIYEWEHSREATVGELLENPERFTVNDVLRAWDAYDSNNAARDEDYTKEELIEGLRAENERMIEDGDGSLEDLTFKARIPSGEVGQIVNRANNRTYAVYANVTNPYIINARQHTLAGANLYPVIEAGMSAAEYDGVIVRNARVGAHQETGDVVIIKEAGQVKLTSNKTPTPSSDISYQQRTDTLTDREVLQVAAEKLAGEKKKVGGEVVDALDEGEKAALEIFTKRLGNLELLEEERAKQGRLYKEQQFGAKVDRAAAAETLNRMHVLDDQIKAANAEVLALEDKEILGRVLKKARKVIEVEQRAHDDEIFKRYVDRAKNAAAIKKYRERIKADVDDLTSWILKPNNKDITKHVPDVIKDSVIPFLESIDFTSKQQLRGGEATKADTELVKRLSGLEAALKKNIEAEGLYSGYTDLPPYFMERLNDFIRLVRELTAEKSGEFVINKMTSEELKELAGVVKVLKAYVTQMNKFHANAMFAHVWEAGDSTIAALSEMGNNGGEANAASNFVFWQQIRPAYAFERFGEGGKAIYDGLRRGQAQLAFNTKKIVDFTEKAYTDKEVKAWEKEIKNIKISAGTVKMRVSDIMSFYELSKQRDSLRHMLGEGMRVATYTADGKKISDNGHALNEGDIAIIIGTLTERQKQVADALQKFMAEQGGAWGNYVSVARFGEELFGNPEYFPINSDGRHLQATADEYPSNASLYALLNMSFTKARNEEAKNRIVVYSIFDVFANHMASMAQYNAMALPVLDAIKWFNYQQKTEDANGERYFKDGVREQMDRVYGVPEETRPGRGRGGYAQSFVLGIIKAFNGTEAQGVPTDTFGMNAMRRYNMAQIAYNFRVVVQQPLAVTRAALLIDYGSIMKGLKLSPAAIKKNVAEMREHSGIAAWKALGFYDVNISRGLTDTIKHSSTLMQDIGEVGMKGAELADTVTWAAMWSACKEEVIKKQKLRPSDAGFYEAVTKLFEDVVYKTQVVDSILTKNEFMRSKGFWARATGSFMSEPTTTASMLIDAVDKYNADLKRGMDRSQAWEKNKRMIGRTIYVYAVSATLLAAVQAIADAWRDDDDYETFLEKWLEAFGGNIVDELMPINKLPILSDFYDVAKEVLSIFGVDTYGNPPQSVFMQWYDSLIKGTEIIYDKIAGKDTNYTWYGGIYKLLQALSGMIGAPMAATTREVVAIWNNIIGAMAPSLKVKTYYAGEENELKYAYADGYLTFEEAARELIEQGLVDNEDEAYFTVSGWEAGEGYSRYDAIYDAVLNGGDFDAAMNELTSHGYTEKDVMRQIKSRIGTWYSDDTSDVRVSKQQAIAMLEKYTDLTDEEITKTVNRWSSKVVTGIAYDDIDEAFLEGKISAARASEMYQRYGGLTTEAAGEKVAVLKFIKDYPQFEAGDVSYSMVEGFLGYGESAGIDVNVFYDVWKYNTAAKADVDKNGKAISGSKKEKVLDYIDSLPLSKKQKDSLYYALGWAESTIREAPWR